jgi:hypothetical protein
VGQYEYSPRVRLVIGAALGVGGLITTVAGLRQLLVVVHPLQSSEMAGVLMGLLILFSGVSIAMPPVGGIRQYLFGALAITCMALLFDWVAFVPGPRDFHSGASALHRGGSVNSTVGRVAFGLFAVFFGSIRPLCVAENPSAAQAARRYRPHVRSRPQPSGSGRSTASESGRCQHL